MVTQPRPEVTRAIQARRPTAPAGRSKILVLRQPVKSVRRSDESKPVPLGLIIGTLATIGAVALAWLLGFVGFRLGFASTLGVPELLTEQGGGLATGALMVIDMPARVFDLALAEPIWFMVAFLLIAIPAGGLAGAKRRTPGGPKPSNFFTGMSWAGAISAAVFGAAGIAYIIAPFRTVLLGSLPASTTEMAAWVAGLNTVAGLDALVFVAMALWAVLSMRVECPPWMRGIAATAAIAALAISAIAMAMTNATASQLSQPRSVAVLASGGGPRVLLGYTREHAAVLNVDGEEVVIEFFDVPSEFWVTDRLSIVDVVVPDDANP